MAAAAAVTPPMQKHYQKLTFSQGLANLIKIIGPQKIADLAPTLQNISKIQYFCINYEFIGHFLGHHFGQSLDDAFYDLGHPGHPGSRLTKFHFRKNTRKHNVFNTFYQKYSKTLSFSMIFARTGSFRF